MGCAAQPARSFDKKFLFFSTSLVFLEVAHKTMTKPLLMPRRLDVLEGMGTYDVQNWNMPFIKVFREMTPLTKILLTSRSPKNGVQGIATDKAKQNSVSKIQEQTSPNHVRTICKCSVQYCIHFGHT